MTLLKLFLLLKTLKMCVCFNNHIEDIGPLNDGQPGSPRDCAYAKRWGQKCQFACNCMNNSQCLSSGFCPQGCLDGWARATNTSPCFKAVDNIGTTATLSLENETIKHNADGFFKFRLTNHETANHYENAKDIAVAHEDTKTDEKNKRTNKQHWVEHLDDINLVVYSFLSEMACEIRRKRLEISWIIKPSTTLSITYIFVRIHSSVSPPSKYIMAEFTLNNHPDPKQHFILLEGHPNATTDVYIKHYKTPILVDHLRLSFSVFSSDICDDKRGAAHVVLYAMPVCPFRRWGIRCEYHCKCPCRIPECHPTTGSCVDHPIYCPRGQYGEHCEKRCSSSCQRDPAVGGNQQDSGIHGVHDDASILYGGPENDTRTCHVVSGYCRSCPTLNTTGPECELQTDAGELSSIVDACSNASEVFYMGFKAGEIENVFDAKPILKRGGGEYSDKQAVGSENVWRGQIALLVVLCSIMLFVIGFGIYVTCVRFWARRRLRDYMEKLERQRIMRSSIKSWSELREEFKLFREARMSKNSELKSNVSSAESVIRIYVSESSVDPRRSGMSPPLSPPSPEVGLPPSLKRVSFRHD